MAGLDETYRRLAERHREVQEKLTELAALADTVVTGQRQFQRVEMERFDRLSQELDAAFEDFTHARDHFARALQGEV